MYSVIVVDDECTAVEHICAIIELKCPEFKVVGTADSGQSGLEAVRKLKPDLVISDIKMPIINGIEFVSLVKKEFPQILSVIVSGYQDFDYAKGAIQSGVCDYILKPITPNNLKGVLETIKVKLSNLYYKKRNEYVKQMAKGLKVEKNILEKYFWSKAYYIAIIRKNGLPRRFGVSDIEMFSTENEKILIYGRDEQEALYLFPEELVFQKDFQHTITDLKGKFKQNEGYTTTIFLKKPYQPTELAEKMKLLYRILDTQTIIGFSQTLSYDEKKGISPQNANPSGIAQESMNELEFIVKERKFDMLESTLKKLLKEWNRQKHPQLIIEKAIRQFFYFIEKYDSSFSIQSCEFMLDEAFYYINGIEDLTENIIAILTRDVLKKDHNAMNIHMPEFFDRITEYIHMHKAEQITLQSVCKVFGISQPTLSKLFKKYTDTSFNSYLTNTRIDYAKEIMKSNHTIYVKDVATIAGYSDQFYFSRIFRSVTGMSPSEYIEQCSAIS